MLGCFPDALKRGATSGSDDLARRFAFCKIDHSGALRFGMSMEIHL
jgi:hypothetical protein